MTGTPDRYLDWLPLSELVNRFDPRNPKRHDEAHIGALIDTVGFTVPVLLDERTGMVAAGHGRCKSLVSRLEAGQQAPAGIRVDPESGEWLVPTVRGWSSKDDATSSAYLIGDNKATIDGGWDNDALIRLLEDQAVMDPALLDLAGFTSEDLDALLRGFDTDELTGDQTGEGDPDRDPPRMREVACPGCGLVFDPNHRPRDTA